MLFDSVVRNESFPATTRDMIRQWSTMLVGEIQAAASTRTIAPAVAAAMAIPLGQQFAQPQPQRPLQYSQQPRTAPSTSPISFATSRQQIAAAFHHTMPPIAAAFHHTMPSITPDKDRNPWKKDTSVEFRVSEYPFLENIEQLVKPFRLPHTTHVSTQAVMFVLSQEQWNGIQRGLVQVRLCLSNMQSGFSAWLGACSAKLSYKINDRPGIIPPRGGSKVCPESLYGANVSTLCVLGKNMLSLTQRDCCCGYVFSMCVIRPHTSLELAMELRQRQRLTSAQAVAKLKEFFGGGADDVQVISSRISMFCPLSLVRIRVPARGIACKHIQCFDLEGFLDYNKVSPKWLCPVCNKPVPKSSLVVDELVQTIVEGTTSDVSEVSVDENGQWTPSKHINQEDSDGGNSEDDKEDIPLLATPPQVASTLQSSLQPVDAAAAATTTTTPPPPPPPLQQPMTMPIHSDTPLTAPQPQSAPPQPSLAPPPEKRSRATPDIIVID